MNILVVVDMQNDFITGPLGTPEAQEAVKKVEAYIYAHGREYDRIVFTRDTHDENYLDTYEGKHLPIPHCNVETDGWNVYYKLGIAARICGCKKEVWHVDKTSFGTMWTNSILSDDTVTMMGVCTDICVISNALIIKAITPYVKVVSSCCAGTTPENHEAALKVMKSCQINIE